MNGWRLYGRYLSLATRTQMQHRASFVMLSTAVLVATFAEFAGVAALFSRFRSLKGWTLPEAAVLFGTVNLAFAVAEALGTAFERAGVLVKSGDFDRLLLRPRATWLQVAGQEIALRRGGRLLVGAACQVWGLHALATPLSAVRLLASFVAAVSSTCVFLGLFVVQGAIAFFTTETLEVMHIVTFGGCEAAQFPMEAYRPSFRRFFTFAVPLALVAYRPLLIAVGRSAPVSIDWLLPLAGPLFLGIALRCWNVGVAHYRSTGS